MLPLREGDTGPFGDLAARPNPEGLVVRHVMNVERLLPMVQHDLGRDLTPDEVAEHRNKAAAIAVTEERSRRMDEAEAGARRQTLDNHQ